VRLDGVGADTAGAVGCGKNPVVDDIPVIVHLSKEHLTTWDEGADLAFAVDTQGRVFPADIGTGFYPAVGGFSPVVRLFSGFFPRNNSGNGDR
jgi:hypothetical protein